MYQKAVRSYWVVVLCLFAMSFPCFGAGDSSATPERGIDKAASAMQWTWTRGASTINAVGSYGALGVPGSGNAPGGRRGGSAWRDGSGRLWLFGGSGYGASGGPGYLNDLWSYDIVANMWTWVKGSSLIDRAGVYGTMGVAAPENSPGGRTDAATWIDSDGMLWMFGGIGRGAAALNYFNDLWRFDPSSGNWTWMDGPLATEQAGIYGQLGVASETNSPGSRRGAACWMDAGGAFWMFGGYGYDSIGRLGYLNDVWTYDKATEQWTWIKGSTSYNQSGEYGAFQEPDPGNTPGGRSYAEGWIDATGCVWLFGGMGYDSSGSRYYLNDLWKFDPASQNWAWMKGASTAGEPGVYGEMGVPAATNVPGGRCYTAMWVDSSGTAWLHGGYGIDSVSSEADLNDLWKLDTNTCTWTWMKGSNQINAIGVYGTMGAPALGNAPGARQYAASWVDGAGALWLFGGLGFGTARREGLLSDLWKWSEAALPVYTVTFQTDGTEGASIEGSVSQPVSLGASTTPVTATAPASHHFVHWTKSGAAYSTDNPLVVSNVTSPMALVASFAINFYTLRYTTDGHGTLSGPVEQWVTHGDGGMSVVAEAAPGYHFVQWSDGVTTAERTDANVTGSIDVTAEFAINQYALTYASDPNGTVVGEGMQTVAHGESGTEILAVAETGYYFVRWSDGSIENPRIDTEVVTAISVTAEFAIHQYSLNYGTQGNGRVDGDTAQTVPYAGSGSEVVAVAGTGSHFVRWSDGRAENPRTDMNVTGNVSVAAVFALDTFELTYLAEPNGTVSGASSQTVEFGKCGLPVTAVADTGYRFSRWSDGKESAKRLDENITCNVRVTAQFEEELPQVIPVGTMTEALLVVGLAVLAISRMTRRQYL